jgi:hypothetical protein
MKTISPVNTATNDIEELMARIRADISRRQSVPTVPTATKLAGYSLGGSLRFNAGGSAEPYLLTGWSNGEPEFRWTDGPTAELGFRLESLPSELILSFRAHPMTGGDVVAQEVSASWNGQPAGEWSIRGHGIYHTLILSPQPHSDGRSVLTFHLPGAFAPSSKNLGADPRRLGLAFYELSLQPAAQFGFR